MGTTAVLSNDGDITSFSIDDDAIRFKTSKALIRYLRVKQWDAGYLVVDALYRGIDGPVEEYIDLVPILENLYRNPREFCESIEEVRIE